MDALEDAITQHPDDVADWMEYAMDEMATPLDDKTQTFAGMTL